MPVNPVDRLNAEQREREEWGARIGRAIAAELGDAECDAVRVLTHLLARIHSPDASGRPTANAVADDLAVHFNTMQTRFIRVGLPSVKTYADALTLLRVASLAEAYPNESVARLSLRVAFSCPQHFGRWMRRVARSTPAAYIRGATESAELSRFLSTMIRPHVVALRAPVLRPDWRKSTGAASRFLSRDVRYAG